MSDRLRISELSEDHVADIDYAPDPIHWLQNTGYPANHQALHLAVNDKPTDDSSGYIVAEIETYNKPPEQADAVRDMMTVFVCNCADFVYRQTPAFDDGATPREFGECKHVQKVKRVHKVAETTEEGQETLV